MGSTFGEWSQPSAEELSLLRLRDTIVDCFTATHGPRFGETRAALGLDDGEDAVRQSVQGIVRLAYTLSGGSFDDPNTRVTARVVNLLAERSAAWGVSEEEIFEHHCRLMRTLGCIILLDEDGRVSAD